MDEITKLAAERHAAVERGDQRAVRRFDAELQTVLQAEQPATGHGGPEATSPANPTDVLTDTQRVADAIARIEKLPPEPEAEALIAALREAASSVEQSPLAKAMLRERAPEVLKSKGVKAPLQLLDAVLTGRQPRSGAESGKRRTARQLDDAIKRTDAAGKPQIVVGTDIETVVDAAELALVQDNEVELFQRNKLIVRVDRAPTKTPKLMVRPESAPTIAPVCEAFLRERLSRAACWIHISKNGDTKRQLPPTWAATTLAARGRWNFPMLTAVVESPTLRPDGSVLDAPGYDVATGLLYEPNAEFPPIPEEPTALDVKKATEALLEPFDEFPFEAPSDRAAILAAILTPVGRHAIDGPTPLFAALAPGPGSGKGLMVLCAVLIAVGRKPTLMTAKHDAAELRKTITTLALEGHAAVLFDNAAGRFGSAVLDAALTTTTWSDRVLGVNKTVTAPLLNTWFVTGNNLTFSGDTPRRVVPIYLDPKVEKPEERRFKREDLIRHVRSIRPLLHVAALTILRGFVVAGAPGHGKPKLGSFEAWDALIRGATIYALGEDPLEGRARLSEDGDSQRDGMRRVFHAWFERFGETPHSAAEAVGVALHEPSGKLHGAFAEYCAKGTPNASSLGYRLRTWRKRIVDGLRLEQDSKGRGGARWRVRRFSVDSGMCDDGTDGDDVSNPEEIENEVITGMERLEESSPSPHRHAEDSGIGPRLTEEELENSIEWRPAP